VESYQKMHMVGMSSALDAHVNHAWGPVIMLGVYLKATRIRGVEISESSQETPGWELTGTRRLIIYIRHH
jgi:hypothetical protein